MDSQILAGILIFDSISKWELIKEEKNGFLCAHTKRDHLDACEIFNTRIHENDFFPPCLSASISLSFVYLVDLVENLWWWLKLFDKTHSTANNNRETHHVAIVLRHRQSCCVYKIYIDWYCVFVCDPKTNQRWKRIRLLLIFFITQNDERTQQQQKRTRMKKKMKKNISKRRIL